MIRREKLEELKELVSELKVVKMTRLEENKDKFLKSIPYSLELNNGVVIGRERLIKGGCDGSAVLIMPMLTNGEVLTVVEPRVFTELTVGVGFPAGYIEKGEIAHAAATRELREETGYVPGSLMEIATFYQDEGVSSALNRIFLATNCKKMFDQELDKDEIIKYMTFNYEELFELEQLGYINGANSIIALEKSKKYILKGCNYEKF